MSVYMRSCPRRRVNKRHGENRSTVAGAYKVLAREKIPGNEWKSQDTAMSTEITLTGQPRGKELEYCVVAMNKAGEGPESNPVMAVL
uniref:Fibronectin type-III domain-containing protein n=1 Tax=Candidatus Kentrum sp. FW TaxID=2126338 RepID=A0A450TL95_9GAMM|nr:MAG: hypothetical protein BECKFW1821B_GA0114236_11445 [Candidatus Kentron sp. FW]